MGIDPYRTLTILVTSMLILASQSPRRRSLLAMLGLDFAVDTADIDETMDPTLPPETEVARLSEAKARAVEQKHPGDLILTADTIVVVDGCVLGKPRDAEEAMAFLRRLSGRRHRVVTHVCVGTTHENARVLASSSDVYVRELTEDEMARYVATGEPFDKAGGYGIQGLGGLFIPRIDGSFTSVMGLPVVETAALLAPFGISLP